MASSLDKRIHNTIEMCSDRLVRLLSGSTQLTHEQMASLRSIIRKGMALCANTTRIVVGRYNYFTDQEVELTVEEYDEKFGTHLPGTTAVSKGSTALITERAPNKINEERSTHLSDGQR
jgi:S-adenosylmethionine:tRNA-ribosyltransferase-isomerase (queuine synthetase)